MPKKKAHPRTKAKMRPIPGKHIKGRQAEKEDVRTECTNRPAHALRTNHKGCYTLAISPMTRRQYLVLSKENPKSEIFIIVGFNDNSGHFCDRSLYCTTRLRELIVVELRQKHILTCIYCQNTLKLRYQTVTILLPDWYVNRLDGPIFGG